MELEKNKCISVVFPLYFGSLKTEITLLVGQKPHEVAVSAQSGSDFKTRPAVKKLHVSSFNCQFLYHDLLQITLSKIIKKILMDNLSNRHHIKGLVYYKYSCLSFNPNPGLTVVVFKQCSSPFRLGRANDFCARGWV